MKRLTGALGLLALVACGGGSSSPSTPTPVAPATPSAVVTAAANGAITLAPSVASAWCCALRLPVRVAETGGGQAKWDYARLQLLRRGVEVERAEIGANILAAPPDVSNIEPNSSTAVALIFRVNSSDFDSVAVTLGITDKTTGRSQTLSIPFSSFSGLITSPVPLSVPDNWVELEG